MANKSQHTYSRTSINENSTFKGMSCEGYCRIEMMPLSFSIGIIFR